jgi:hypothetical protein
MLPLSSHQPLATTAPAGAVSPAAPSSSSSSTTRVAAPAFHSRTFSIPVRAGGYTAEAWHTDGVLSTVRITFKSRAVSDYNFFPVNFPDVHAGTIPPKTDTKLTSDVGAVAYSNHTSVAIPIIKATGLPNLQDVAKTDWIWVS